MKLKFILLFFVAGLVLGLLGTLGKIEQFPYADLIIMAGLASFVVGGVLGLYRLLTSKALDR